MLVMLTFSIPVITTCNHPPIHPPPTCRPIPLVFPIHATQKTYATAFLLSPTLALTALHALSPPRTPHVAGHATTLHRVSSHADIALLSLSKPLTPPFRTLLASPFTNVHTFHVLLPSPTPPVPVFFLRLDAPHFVFSAVRVPALVFRGQGTSGWSGAPVVSPAIGVVGMIIQAGNNEIHVVPACILKHVSNAACFDTSIGTLSVPYASLRELAAKQVHNDGCIDWYGLRAPAVFAIWNLVGKCVKAVVMRGEVAKRELLQVGVTHGKMGGRWDGVAVVCRGFVFVRLSLQYLQSFGREWRWEAPTQLVERMGGREGEEEEVVVIARGKGCLHRVVVVVRGEKVRGLKDLVGGGVFELDDGRKLHMKGGEMRKYNKE